MVSSSNACIHRRSREEAAERGAGGASTACFISKRLPHFFISDVMDEDAACTMGEAQEKRVLHDDLGCRVDGEYMGKVSKDTIAKMSKAN